MKKCNLLVTIRTQKFNNIVHTLREIVSGWNLFMMVTCVIIEIDFLNKNIFLFWYFCVVTQRKCHNKFNVYAVLYNAWIHNKGLGSVHDMLTLGFFITQLLLLIKSSIKQEEK